MADILACTIPQSVFPPSRAGQMEEAGGAEEVFVVVGAGCGEGGGGV